MVCTGPPGAPLGFVPATGHVGAGASGRGCRVHPSRQLVLAAPPRDSELHQQHSNRTGVSTPPWNLLPEAPVPQHPGPASLIYRNVRRNTHPVLPHPHPPRAQGAQQGALLFAHLWWRCCLLAVGSVFTPPRWCPMATGPGGGCTRDTGLPSQHLRRARGACPTCKTSSSLVWGHRRRSAGFSHICLAPDHLAHAHWPWGFPSWGRLRSWVPSVVATKFLLLITRSPLFNIAYFMISLFLCLQSSSLLLAELSGVC